MYSFKSGDDFDSIKTPAACIVNFIVYRHSLCGTHDNAGYVSKEWLYFSSTAFNFKKGFIRLGLKLYL